MTDVIPIFDCMTHPSASGRWLPHSAETTNTFARLHAEMREADVRWAFAVGMQDVAGYDPGSYARLAASDEPRLLPIAYFDFAQVTATRDVRPYLVALKDLGYVGVKIHPRLSHLDLLDERVIAGINTAHELGLVTILCTYFYSDCPCCARKMSVEKLGELLSRARDARLILAHGGGVRLLEVAEMVRAFAASTLLDLSFTLCKYEGSSVDLDIAFLFRHFDRRICVGSDHPEFSLLKLRQRFETFAAGLADDKKKNIAYRNLAAFTGIKMTNPDL